MAKTRLLRTLAFVMVALALFYGLLEIFLTRHQDPKAYPPYSSFRWDPLGAMVFYKALERIEGVTVSRNLLPLNYGALPEDASLFFAGAEVTPDPVRLLERLEAFADWGGRIVITHAACENRWNECWAHVDNQVDHVPVEENTPPYAQMAYISERWDFDYEVENFDEQREFAFLAENNKHALSSGLPLSLPWRNALYFNAVGDEWEVRYAIEGRAVVIERAWGKGSILIASDSYFMSNEAMRDDRHPALLAWLAGPNRHVMFDESHFGIVSTPGVIDLIYSLRLQGFLVLAAVLAALYVWMSLASPVPRREATAFELTAKTRGREASSGLVSLLRRSVAPGDLLACCHAAWRESLPMLGPRAKTAAGELERVAGQTSEQTRPADIVETYRRMCRINQEKR